MVLSVHTRGRDIIPDSEYSIPWGLLVFLLTGMLPLSQVDRYDRSLLAANNNNFLSNFYWVFSGNYSETVMWSGRECDIIIIWNASLIQNSLKMQPLSFRSSAEWKFFRFSHRNWQNADFSYPGVYLCILSIEDNNGLWVDVVSFLPPSDFAFSGNCMCSIQKSFLIFDIIVICSWNESHRT